MPVPWHRVHGPAALPLRSLAAASGAQPRCRLITAPAGRLRISPGSGSPRPGRARGRSGAAAAQGRSHRGLTPPVVRTRGLCAVAEQGRERGELLACSYQACFSAVRRGGFRQRGRALNLAVPAALRSHPPGPSSRRRLKVPKAEG